MATSGKKLTEKERARLFTAWKQLKSTAKVSRKCHVSEKTVCRYRKLDKWDERLQTIRSKAQHQADNQAAYRLSNELLGVDALVRHELTMLLKQAKEEAKAVADGGTVRKGSIAVLDRLVRLKLVVLPEVEPELPPDERQSKIAEALKKLEDQQVEDVAELYAKILAGKRDGQAKGG